MKPVPVVLALISFLASGIPLVSADSTPREQAKFLAGLPLSPQSPLAAAQQEEAYKSHQKEISDKWAFCRKVRYEAMQKWGEENLGKVKGNKDIVRYLFGGPDFLNAYALFPSARVMVLGGLEPVGEVPPPEMLKTGMLGQSLASLRQALRTSLYCGYFITSEMGGQLHQGCFRGVLPVLYTELALTGNSVDSVDFEQPFGASGVRITYHRPGHSQQTLYYFQSNLANGEQCRRFLSWLGTFGEGATYLKAASYLLHGSEFSQARDFLLGTSTIVVQDDSGIPYRYFARGGWNIRLYGEYESPLPIFSGYAQKDFRIAYKTPVFVGPLSFGVGYHVAPSQANILLAVPVHGGGVASKTQADGSVRENDTTQTKKDHLARVRDGTKKDQAKSMVSAKPSHIAGDAIKAETSLAPDSDQKVLAALEDEELSIRQDTSLSKDECNARLQDVWNRQLIAMGKAPVYKVALHKATDALTTQSLISPTATLVEKPAPTSAPVPDMVALPDGSSSPVPLASPTLVPSSAVNNASGEEDAPVPSAQAVETPATTPSSQN
jgi:hypothetical protein